MEKLVILSFVCTSISTVSACGGNGGLTISCTPGPGIVCHPGRRALGGADIRNLTATQTGLPPADADALLRNIGVHYPTKIKPPAPPQPDPQIDPIRTKSSNVIPHISSTFPPPAPSTTRPTAGPTSPASTPGRPITEEPDIAGKELLEPPLPTVRVTSVTRTRTTSKTLTSPPTTPPKVLVKTEFQPNTKEKSDNSISTASTVKTVATVATTVATPAPTVVQGATVKSTSFPVQDRCHEPFNREQDKTISSLSQVYRTSMEAKADSPRVCSFLCLQRTGACHAFAYDSSKTLCRIFGTGITVYDLTLAAGVDFYYIKEECLSPGPLLTVKLGSGEQTKFDKPVQGPPILIEPMDSLVIEKTPGFQQLGFGLVYEPYTENQCIEFCKTNSTPTGMARHCLAADHNLKHSRCFLMTQDREKTGSLEKLPELYPSPDFVHFRKLFLSRRWADACGGYLTAHPQRALVGYDQEAYTAASYGLCIQRCLQLATQQNLCKSGSFYAKEDTGNCILSFEDEQSKPKSFIEVNSDELIVEYFSIRTCTQKAIVNEEERRYRYFRRRRFF